MKLVLQFVSHKSGSQICRFVMLFAVTRDKAASILQAAQGLMNTVHSPVGSMGGPSPQRGVSKFIVPEV